MKNKYFKWKYGVVVLLSAIVCACSENNELAQMVNRQEQQGETRTAELKTKTIELETEGTLSTKLPEAMGEEEISTLEKLVVSGPFNFEDLWYLKNNLTNLVVLDIANVQIKDCEGGIYVSGHRLGTKENAITRMMFYDMSIKEVILPLDILYIDEQAFYSCDELEKVIIPDKVKTIGSFAFGYCSNLSSIVFSSSSELDSIANCAFYDTNLKSITIPDKVRKIGRLAFHSCDSLTSVTLPSELQEIESSLFSYCKQLESVAIPDKVKYIEDSAFEYCSNLSSIVFSSSSELDSIDINVFYNTNLKSIIIPDKVRFIGWSAFSDCSKLSAVEFSSTSQLDSIAPSAFNNTNLKSITLPNNLRGIGYHAFASCDSLVTVILPPNLEYLGFGAFEYCYSLTSIDIPDKVKQIGDNTFYRCTSLESINLPENLESIGRYAITSTLIESIEFPSTLKTISEYAFEHNDYLTKVVLPEGVETIGTQVFRSNTRLKELTIPETVTSIEAEFAYNCQALQVLYWNAPLNVPYNSYTWNTFLYIETDQNVTADDSWNNVIVNGVAQSTITIEARNNEFTCYKEFTAPEVVYTRYFGDETVPGGSSGWQTIVLPFTPDSIGHESKGEIAPFNSDKEDTKPFWLRELTADGFVDVTTIEPDKPYIIAMPNHSDYLDEYRLNGTITFSAKNVTIKKTPDTLQPSVGPDFDFHPTYKFVKKALYVYTLEQQWGTYDNMWYGKNFFARSSNDVAAFNAYVTAPGGGRSSRSTYDIDTRSKESRAKYSPNNTGIPQIGDM